MGDHQILAIHWQKGTAQDEFGSDVRWIYRIPEDMVAKKPNAFVPQVVSIGPFHYGNNQLAKYETSKGQYSQYLSCRPGRPLFRKLVEEITDEKIRIQKWYFGQSNSPLDERSLGRMLARDALFLLRVLRRNCQLFEPGLPGFAVHEDILKFENQMPLFVVKRVFQWDVGTDEGFHLTLSRACRALCPFPNIRGELCTLREDSHLLAFLYQILTGSSDLTHYTEHNRISLANAVESNRKVNSEHHRMWKKRRIPLSPAVELKSKGVKFAVQSELAFSEICFDDKNRTFHLPIIEMDSRTDTIMRNLLTFETLVCKEGSRPLMCYMDMMERLIDKADDVKVLRNAGIIYNHLGTDEEVAVVWNGMRNVLEEVVEYGPIDTAIDGVTAFCKSRYRIMYTEFKRKYFSRPWLAAAFIGGCSSLLLSIFQTLLAWEQVRLQRQSMQNMTIT